MRNAPTPAPAMFVAIENLRFRGGLVFKAHRLLYHLRGLNRTSFPATALLCNAPTPAPARFVAIENLPIHAKGSGIWGPVRAVSLSKGYRELSRPPPGSSRLRTCPPAKPLTLPSGV